ncbi:AEC family transporter [Halobacillus karajensis]|uniref:Auxin efflux carrier n=1 Tax=Halobacillus karajensis TaxID=195088 RepID=A0A059NWJ5_9BACI|nr:AEC family transporter [Halobacillus karajensis]CDQ19020.1 auxin efflux carrier [Halobacillus karajensis]CDQ22906.1 auxin efflux carrier [Halobacillus karajensis]CDQ26388.1 auxin efflux carrier [Halobacillus karajensis]
MEILFIFLNIIVPVFILIGIGAAMHKAFKLDLFTLAKLNIYFLSPGFVLVNLYESSFSLDLLGKVLLFFSLFIFVLYIVVQMVAWIGKYNKAIRGVFTNSVLLYNSGNYGIPVNDLAFKQDPFAATIQVIVMTLQNVFSYTYGVFSLRAVDEGKGRALIGLLKMPAIYAMTIGVLLNVGNVDVPEFILKPGEYVANAMVGIALITLGAQVAQLTIQFKLIVVYISLFIRLLLGPMLALLLIWALGFEGVLAQALLISSGMPSSVNSAIIAQEYRSEPELAAQIVLASTVFSMGTVTLTIYFAQILF